MGSDTHHNCWFDGCTRQVPHIYLMCRQHWLYVPRKEQVELYAAFRDREAGVPGAGERWRQAALAAAAAAKREFPTRSRELPAPKEPIPLPLDPPEPPADYVTVDCSTCGGPVDLPATEKLLAFFALCEPCKKGR